jgi:hypothetical protein
MLGVGDEVICIDDKRPDGWTAEHFPQWVVVDAKYTIREILDNDNIAVGVLLEELINPEVFISLLGRIQESAFATWRFSKLRSAYELAEESKEEEVVAAKDELI